jgi:hypothetical protein
LGVTLELGQLLQEKEWRLCVGPDNATIQQQVEAFSYFCENYWFIKHPERGRIKFELRDAQLETIETWMTERYSVVLKARQIGFSTLAAAYSFWLTYFRPDRFVIMLSRTEREAMKLLAKSKYGYKFLPPWMRERGPRMITDHQLKMIFSNESAIESLPSGSDPARGESVYLVIVDEWAFLPNPEEAWASIEPVADVGGRVIGLSTANGSGNFFHNLWVGSQTGSNQFVGIFFPWNSDGERGDDWYEAKSKNMQPWQLHQEYPRFPEEAFIKSGNPVFDIDMLDSMSTVEAMATYIFMSPDGVEIEYGEDGPFHVWYEPEPDGVYVVGADVAEGLSYGDYSSAHVIDARDGIVVAHWHGHIEPDMFGETLSHIGEWYNKALIGVENNNHGLTTLKALQRTGYRNIYKQRRLGLARPEATETLGWRTTVSSKPLAIDELSAGLRDEAIIVLCARTIAELRTYVRKENGKMAGSPHDDRTMSLAIAVQMIKYVWLPEYRSDTTVPTNSLLWWEQHIMHDVGDNRVPLGAHNVRSGNNRT